MLDYFASINLGQAANQNGHFNHPTLQDHHANYLFTSHQQEEEEDTHPFRYSRPTPPSPRPRPPSQTNPRIQYFTPDDIKPEIGHELEHTRLPLQDLYRFDTQEHNSYDIFQNKDNMPRLVPKPR